MKKILFLLSMVVIFSMSACTKSVPEPEGGNSIVDNQVDEVETIEKVTVKPTEKETEIETSSKVNEETQCQHSFSIATCTQASICSKCGVSNGDAKGHIYSVATCTEPQKCTRCGETQGTALGHSYQQATCTEAQKCSQCGTTQGTALGHSFQAATCSAPQKCTKCGITNGGVTEHKFDNNGLCVTCNKKITAEDLANTIECKLIVPRNGTNNYYANVQIGNASGAEMKISPYIWINGFGCNTHQDFYYLSTGYQITLPAYRALRADLIYEDKYCDMYLDNNSECHFVATMYGVSFVIYGDVNGNTRIELN